MAFFLLGPAAADARPASAGGPADDLMAPLPEIDAAAPPVEMAPVSPPDPALTAPLPPIGSFDTTPRTDLQFTATAEEGARYTVVVEGAQATGVEGRFRSLSALVQGQGKSATPAQVAARTNTDRALLERLLFSEGWYGASVDSRAEPADGGTTRVRFTVAPGERYHWRQISLDLYPDAPADLGAGFGLKAGAPIRAEEVELAEGALLIRMRQRGYPFAEIGARDVVLDADQPTGTYLLTADIGPRARFGRIEMRGFRPFDERHAADIARFRAGELYDADMVDDFRRALIQTQLFGGLTVVPVDTGARNADGTAVADIRVQASKGPLRRFAGQIGFSTGEGLRAEASWRHRNLVKPEGGFTARAVAGTREQRLAAELALANWGQRDRTLSGMFDVANINRPAFQARTATASAALARLSTPIWQKRWTWSAGAELIASDERDRSFDINAPRQTYIIVALPLSVAHDTSDNLFDPTRGWRAGLRASPEYSRQGGDGITYVRLIGDASAYRSLSEALVLAGRVRVGSIVGSSRLDIAPTRRLYAGGGGSVRGFDYQDVGPLGADNRPRGGRGLAEASVEGRYRFGDFGIVGFVDAGTLTESSSPTLDNIHVGAGVGGRYYTSFGPIRVDVARAVNHTTRAPKIALYISIGQAF